MNLTNTMVCWNPDSTEIALVPWPDRVGASDNYDFTEGACDSKYDRKNFEHRKMLVFILAMQMIIRDNMPPNLVHSVLLSLEEYKDGLADDVPGVLA